MSDSKPTAETNASDNEPVIPAHYLMPFILVTTLFALWGFANDITNPMVAAFKNVLLISNFESSLVQAAFYGGYCFMAIPAALFIRKFSYKSGILMGLTLYVVGCMLFIPAGQMNQFSAFLLAYFTMTCGLAFLETTANPYILALGPAHNAPRRLNFAQAFNPVGSICGMLVARNLILQRLDQTDEAGRRALQESDPSAFAAIQQSDLSVIVWPYVTLGVVVFIGLLIFLFSKLPEGESEDTRDPSLGASLGRLFSSPRYLGGVVAQAFYVGAQITCWTFIIQYGTNELGMTAAKAQTYNIAAMIIFVTSRFICTYLLKFVSPGPLLGTLAVGGGALILGAMFIKGMPGMICLVGVSACMSLMFPTIYGIALRGLGDDAKLGSAGLICAIGGGSLMPPLQAWIMDGNGIEMLSATRLSFVLPLICFVVIAIYGFAVSLSKPTETNLQQA